MVTTRSKATTKAPPPSATKPKHDNGNRAMKKPRTGKLESTSKAPKPIKTKDSGKNATKQPRGGTPNVLSTATQDYRALAKKANDEMLTMPANKLVRHLGTKEFFEETAWVPRIQPYDIEDDWTPDSDVVLRDRSKTTLRGTAKARSGNKLYLRLLTSHAKIIGKIQDEYAENQRRHNTGRPINTDYLIQLFAKLVVRRMRDGGARFLSRVNGESQGRRRSRGYWTEVGDIAAVNLTKKQLESLALEERSNKSNMEKKAATRNEEKTIGAVDKPLPPRALVYKPSSEEKGHFDALPLASQEQVRQLRALEDWNVAAALKLLNIPAFDEDEREEPSLSPLANTGNDAVSAGGNETDNMHEHDSQGATMTESFSTLVAAEVQCASTRGEFLMDGWPEEDTEMLSPQAGKAKTPAQKRSSCPPLHNAEVVPTLDELLFFQDELFARDSARPGTIVADTESAENNALSLSSSGYPREKRRSSCPPGLLSPAIETLAKKNIRHDQVVKQQRSQSQPVQATLNDQLEPLLPPAIVRATSSTLNVHEILAMSQEALCEKSAVDERCKDLGLQSSPRPGVSDLLPLDLLSPTMDSKQTNARTRTRRRVAASTNKQEEGDDDDSCKQQGQSDTAELCGYDGDDSSLEATGCCFSLSIG